ncbi:amidase family protein [Nocardia sp. CA-151230]|uniref:amidase family protein n=1 Tax=Nocardia sp. CA-151230 TaxID=3239982 RepID=UPI003D89CD3F
MGWSFQSAEELAVALRAGQVTSMELTDDAIARIERYDPAINSICVPDFDQARAADRARAGGEDRPLLGIPVTVKESFDVAGLPTTWGMPAYANHLPDEDAVQVSRLKNAGAVVLGKDQCACHAGRLAEFQRALRHHQQSVGPQPDAGRILRRIGCRPGSRIRRAVIGSDRNGSLRSPAHCCGIYAHKPTPGLAAVRGMAPPPAPALPVDSDRAVVGPMARTARDLSLLFDVMAGPDPLTLGMAYQLTLPPARHERLGDFRVLVLDEHPLIPVGSAERAGVNRVADALVCAGARVQQHSRLLPDLTDAATLFAQLLGADIGAQTGRSVRAVADTRRRTDRRRPWSRGGPVTGDGVQPP